MQKQKEEDLCAKCPAICCKYITIEIDKPTNKRERDDVRWYLLHEGITLLIEKNNWHLKVPTTCEHLQDDDWCGIYEDRPQTCRNYSTENCDYHTEFEGWETEYIELETAEEYQAYLDSKKKAKAKTKTKSKAKEKTNGKVKKKKDSTTKRAKSKN